MELIEISNYKSTNPQTNILDVHFRFKTKYPNNFCAIFEKVSTGQVQINVIAIKNNSVIPELYFRIQGGPSRILPENTIYPLTLNYDEIYLVLINTKKDSAIPKTIIQAI